MAKYIQLLQWALKSIIILSAVSCSDDFTKLNDNISYKIISNNTEPSLTEGQYVFYQYSVHAGLEILFDSRTLLEPQKYRIPAKEQFKQIDNPVIKMMEYLASGDSAIVKYKLHLDKKYPKEFNGYEEVEYRVKILEILDEEYYISKQSDKRNEQLKHRQDYFELKNSKVNSLESILNDIIKSPSKLKELKEGIKFMILDGELIKQEPSKNNKPEGVNTNKNIKFSYILFNDSGNYLFSSYENREPYTFQIGSPKVMPAWNILAEQFKPGDELITFIPSSQAYGSEGFKGNIEIPPHSNLYCYIIIENH